MTLLLGLTQISCSSQIDDYKQTGPAFDLQDYFTGNITAWGIVQDYQNKVTRRFCVDIDGRWKQNKGVLKEIFYFDDGEVSYRTWQLMRLPDGQYIGTAGDVIGQAMGRESGFAFHWNYILKVNVDGSDYKISMDDWMYRIDEQRVFNKTTMSKFGIKVGEVTLFFDKQASLSQCKK